MIPVITAGSNFYGVLAYCDAKDPQEMESVNGIITVPGSERLAILHQPEYEDYESSISELSERLHQWSNRSKRLNKCVFHASLAFAKTDTLDNERMVSVARSFLNKMGYQDIPAVIYKHNDTDHAHIHIVTSRLGVDGKKVSDSYEVKKAIRICRELELEYDLTRVEEGKRLADLTVAADSSIDLLPKRAFKNVVLTNLQYYLNKRKVDTEMELKASLLKHHIELVTTDAAGNSLPNSGVLFFRTDKGLRKSFLKGKDFGPGFGKAIVSQLQKNAQFRKNWKMPHHQGMAGAKPDKVTWSKYGKLLFEAYDTLERDILYTRNDIERVFEGLGIQADLYTSGGELKGLSVHSDGKKYKGSDFTWLGTSLSVNALKKGFVPLVTGQALANHVRKLLSTRPAWSLAEIHILLNRHGISIQKRSGQYYFAFKRQGKEYLVSIDKEFTSYEMFLSSVGYNGKRDLTINQQASLDSGEYLVDQLSLAEKHLYFALLKNDQHAIRRLTKYPLRLPIHKTEMLLLNEGYSTFFKYAAINEAMVRAKRFLSHRTETGNINTMPDFIKSLNKRGIGIQIQVDSTSGMLKQVEFFSLANPVFRLNSYECNSYFSTRVLRDLYKQLATNDRSRLAAIVNNAHFAFKPASMIALQEIELGHVILKESSLRKDPDFIEDYLYLAIQPRPNRKEAPYNKEKYYMQLDSFLTADEITGTMLNKGMDEDYFSWQQGWRNS